MSTTNIQRSTSSSVLVGEKRRGMTKEWQKNGTESLIQIPSKNEFVHLYQGLETTKGYQRTSETRQVLEHFRFGMK